MRAPPRVFVCARARTRVCVNVDVRIRTELLERALDAGIQGHQIEADGCSSSASVFLSSVMLKPSLRVGCLWIVILRPMPPLV